MADSDTATDRSSEPRPDDADGDGAHLVSRTVDESIRVIHPTAGANTSKH